MCTMTWLGQPDGYEVFFNRDERRTRQPATGPRLAVREHTRYLAPADGDFGGSWIAVNECGLTLALENGYTDHDDRLREPATGFTSRGLLLTSLIGERSSREVLARLTDDRLRSFRSFLLALFTPDGGRVLARWLGGRLTVEREIDPLMPLVSSSFETEAVCRMRRTVFRRMAQQSGLEQASLHLAFHASHDPERGPRSPCMHRPDAHTVSFSRIEVGPRDVRFHYVDHSPCRGTLDETPLTLPRSPMG